MTQHSRFRFLYAYATAGQIFLSYLWLWFLKRIFGEKRLALKIEKTHTRNARRILATILKLKGLFIKVGQMISIMTTFLPSALTRELEALQDAVPPRPYVDIEKRFFEEFKKKPTELFLNFEEKPIASASLGQVHLATLKDNRHAAVKVQYPEIEEIVRIDLKTLKRIFGFLHLLFPNYGLKQIYVEVAAIVLQELNFISEGKNLETLQENFKEEPDFLFPKVHWEYSTERVLTLEFMEGIKISNVDQLKAAGINPTEVATKIIHAYCKQIFIDGVYHADPHPGNFLVQPGPKIIMMDFGAIARISDKMRRGVAQFIEGIIHRDNRIISQAMKEMGFIAKTENEEVFDHIVEFFYDRLKDIKLEDVKNLNLTNVGKIEDFIEFRKLDVSLAELLDTFNVPKDWALMERALLLLFGLTTHLDPSLNPLSIIIPYAEQFVLGKGKRFGDLILEAMKEIALSYLRLPSELNRTLRKLNQGELEFTSKNSKTTSPLLARSLHRLNLTFLCFGTASLSYILYKEQISNYHYPLYASGFFGLWLIGAFLRRK
jgi:ubiquinone biosynthesis protein